MIEINLVNVEGLIKDTPIEFLTLLKEINQSLVSYAIKMNFIDKNNQNNSTSKNTEASGSSSIGSLALQGFVNDVGTSNESESLIEREFGETFLGFEYNHNEEVMLNSSLDYNEGNELNKVGKTISLSEIKSNKSVNLKSKNSKVQKSKSSEKTNKKKKNNKNTINDDNFFYYSDKSKDPKYNQTLKKRARNQDDFLDILASFIHLLGEDKFKMTSDFECQSNDGSGRVFLVGFWYKKQREQMKVYKELNPVRYQQLLDLEKRIDFVDKIISENDDDDEVDLKDSNEIVLEKRKKQKYVELENSENNDLQVSLRNPTYFNNENIGKDNRKEKSDLNDIGEENSEFLVSEITESDLSLKITLNKNKKYAAFGYNYNSNNENREKFIFGIGLEVGENEKNKNFRLFQILRPRKGSHPLFSEYVLDSTVIEMDINEVLAKDIEFRQPEGFEKEGGFLTESSRSQLKFVLQKCKQTYSFDWID